MKYDAIVVGAGPNGLAAAITLAEYGRSVLLVEANETVGGAARSGRLTRPGFVHDLGSAVHPLGLASPFFRRVPLEKHGLEWVQPGLPLAHPLDGGQAAWMHQSLDETEDALGPDGGAWKKLMAPLSRNWKALMHEVLQPVVHVPRHPITLARFGLRAICPAKALAEFSFSEEPARALFAGIAAHANLPLTAPGSAAFGLMLGLLGHAVGWSVPRGGAQSIADALASYFESLGGEIQTGRRVGSLDELPPARTLILDVTPRQLLRLADGRLPALTHRRLKKYRYGPAAFKIDYALSEPIPWAHDACKKAGTVHVGGTLAEITAAEQAVADGEPPAKPFILLAQPSLFDDTRAPEGKHTAWAYCHVPNGSSFDMTGRMERQIERFAPGFGDVIEERFVSGPAVLEGQNANLVGGDINGGLMTLPQLVARPILSLNPYRMAEGLYLCSSSTPPGGGVHGMGGVHAARSALRDFRR